MSVSGRKCSHIFQFKENEQVFIAKLGMVLMRGYQPYTPKSVIKSVKSPVAVVMETNKAFYVRGVEIPPESLALCFMNAF